MEPNRTPYDLEFRLFGIPVRVHPMFWLMALVLGNSALRSGWQYVLIWVACVFVSVLVHELGHVLAGQSFGSHGHIVLYGLGGLAINSSNLSSRWQRIGVYFAGPLAGFLLLGGLLAILYAADQSRFYLALNNIGILLGIPVDWAVDVPPFRNPYLDAAIRALIFTNLIWGLLNLLPIWPLDGGQICRDVCGAIFPGRGLRISLGISFVVAGLLAIHCLMDHFERPLIPFFRIGSLLTALFFGVFAFQSFHLLQQTQRSQRSWDDWNERDPNIWR